MKTKQTTTNIVLTVCLLCAGGVQAQQNTSVFSEPIIANSNVVLSWTGGGVLQTSPTLFGPWTTVVSDVKAQSSATIPVASGARFARTIQLGTASDPLALLQRSPGTAFSPLKIESASLRLLSEATDVGKAVLEMAVAPNSAILTNQFDLLTDDTTVTTFRDDGVFPDVEANDRRFSAVVSANTNDLVAANDRLATILPERLFNLTVDKFTKRVLATNTIVPFDVSKFANGASIPIFNPGIKLPCDGIAGAYDWRKTLMITDLSVVQDSARTWDPCSPAGGAPAGVWTFGFLMEEICNSSATGIDPSDFVKNWLETFDAARPINTDIVPANPSVRSLILDPWLAASQAGGKPPGTLDLRKSPFRLLAIVNRLDLRGNSTYGPPAAKNPCDVPCIGGESRFVFCATGENCQPIPFLVIMEYCNPQSSCKDIQALGKMWADLNKFPSFNGPYRAALEAITANFSLRNAIPGRPPNGSALNQLRVNEFLGGGEWRLYEFKLAPNGSDAGHLRSATVAQTPDFDLNNTAAINNICPLPAVPLFLNHQHVLGGWAPIASPWEGNPAIGSPARHNWAMRACNGCHGAEAPTNPFTGTPPNPFTHVGCRNLGDTAQLSEFLTGKAVWPDPVSGGNVGPFRELDDRVQKLDQLVNCPCGFFNIFFDPVVFIDPTRLLGPDPLNLEGKSNLGVFVH